MKAFTFRMDDEVFGEFSCLADTYRISKNNLLNMLVRNEYHNKVANDPQIEKLESQLDEMRAMFERFKSDFQS